jgi:hypothetical protein
VKATVNYEPTTIYADDVIIASGGLTKMKKAIFSLPKKQHIQ